MAGGQRMSQMIEHRQVGSVGAKSTIPTTVDLQVDSRLTSWESEKRTIVVQSSTFLNEFGKIFEGTQTMTVVRYRQRVAAFLSGFPLCGLLGAHRFYTAKCASALAMAVLTLGATAGLLVALLFPEEFRDEELIEEVAISRPQSLLLLLCAVVLGLVLIMSWVDCCKIRSGKWRDGHGDPLSTGVLGAPPYSHNRPKAHILSYEEAAPKDLPSFIGEAGNATPMTVTAQTITGQEIRLETRADATIGALKLLIEEQTGTAVGMQRLVFNDKPYRDDVALWGIGVRDGAKITLVMREAVPPPTEAAPEEGC